METSLWGQVGELGQTVRRVNGDAPGQSCRVAIQFLVDEITPAPDGLGQRQANNSYVGPA